MTTLAHAIALSVALATAGCAPRQQPTAVYGTVRDTIGAPIRNAQIVASGVEGPTLTDSLGRYRIDSLSPGQLSIRALMIGYFAEQRDSVQLRPGHATRVDFVLRSPDCDIDCAPMTVPIAPPGAEVPDNGR